MQRPVFMSSDRGAVLNIALLLLLLLSLIVLALSRLSATNMKIAAFDKQSKTSFTNADSGIEVGSRLIEENLSCPGGFTQNAGDPAGKEIITDVQVNDLNLWVKAYPPGQPVDTVTAVTNANDIFFPTNYAQGDPHTNITLGGEARTSTGSGVTMVAGYDGLGRAAAAGGSYIHYEVLSHHLGRANSQSKIQVAWRHMIGFEGVCNY